AANRARENFDVKFWNPKSSCLYDVLEASEDVSLRPNQVFAVSLDYPILARARWQSVVEVVERELVTPFGLRTLSPSDRKFVGKCVGDRASRDRAYHNGTIWPWLLGPYISAYLKNKDHDKNARENILQKLVEPFFRVGISQAGLGTISEIYDADSPNPPRGCISQAWSLAEPLRAYIEDVLLVKPRLTP
ncbi:MAG: amylo-alpha-1,6-glucosidase, partial [Candidatus Bathyarchaeia archaeon]